MGKKTLGIIGSGKVVQQLFEHIGQTAAQRDQAHPGNHAKLQEFPIFEDIFERVIVYNHAYSNSDYFKETDSFQKISDSLSLLSEQGTRVSCDVLGRVRYDSHGNSSEDASELEKLVVAADVIVDASGLGGSFLSKNEKDNSSLINYALGRSGLSDIRNENQSLSWSRDYDLYQEAARGKGIGRVLPPPAQFKQQWQCTKELIDAALEVHAHFPLGPRSLVVTPHNLPSLLDRAVMLQNVMATLQSKGIQRLPTYIMVANEPCQLSYFLAQQIPSLAPYLVASAGVDGRRLEYELNSEYAELLKKEGLAPNLRVVVSGFHDGGKDTPLTVPVIYPQNPAEDSDFAKLGEISYDRLHRFVQERVNSFFQLHHSEPDASEEIKELLNVDQNLLETILAAAQSRGRALSLQPGHSDLALNNGYYIQDATQGPRDYFFVGKQRFRNGMTHGEPLRTGAGPIHEFITTEIGASVETLKMLLHEMSEPVQRYVRELRKDEPKDDVLLRVVEPVAGMPELNLQQELEKKCYVVVKGRKGERKLGSNILEFSQQQGAWKGPQLIVGEYFGRPYTTVLPFTIENVPYLAAAFSEQMLDGVEIINLSTIGKDTMEKENEKVDVILNDSIHPLSRHDNNRSFTGLGVTSNSLEGLLVAMHQPLGFYAVPFTSLLSGERQQVYTPLLGFNPDLHQHSALLVAPEEVVVSRGRDIYRIKDMSREDFPRPIGDAEKMGTFTESIISLAGTKEEVYAATVAGKIFHKEKVFFDAQVPLLKINPGEYSGESGIYYLTAARALSFTNGQRSFPIVYNAVIDFSVNGGTIFSLEREKLSIFSAGSKVYETSLKAGDIFPNERDVHLKAVSIWG